MLLTPQEGKVLVVASLLQVLEFDHVCVVAVERDQDVGVTTEEHWISDHDLRILADSFKNAQFNLGSVVKREGDSPHRCENCANREENDPYQPLKALVTH